MRHRSLLLPCLLALLLAGGHPLAAQNARPAPPDPAKSEAAKPEAAPKDSVIADTVARLNAKAHRLDSLHKLALGENEQLKSSLQEKEQQVNYLILVLAVLAIALIACVVWLLPKTKKRNAQTDPNAGGQGSAKGNKKDIAALAEKLKKAEKDLAEQHNASGQQQLRHEDEVRKLGADMTKLEAHTKALETDGFYRFDTFEKFSSGVEACLHLLEEAEKFAIAQIEKGKADGPAQALSQHALRALEHKENVAKWDSILRVLRKRGGAIYDPHLISDMKNRVGDEAKTEELKAMFFREAFLHRCGNTLILLEELRFLAALSGGQAALEFATRIADIRKRAQDTFGADLSCVQLGDNAAQHKDLQNRPVATLRPYLEALGKDAKPDQIIQIISIGAKGEGLNIPADDTKTQVVIKK